MATYHLTTPLSEEDTHSKPVMSSTSAVFFTPHVMRHTSDWSSSLRKAKSFRSIWKGR